MNNNNNSILQALAVKRSFTVRGEGARVPYPLYSLSCTIFYRSRAVIFVRVALALSDANRTCATNVDVFFKHSFVHFFDFINHFIH